MDHYRPVSHTGLHSHPCLCAGCSDPLGGPSSLELFLSEQVLRETRASGLIRGDSECCWCLWSGPAGAVAWHWRRHLYYTQYENAGQLVCPSRAHVLFATRTRLYPVHYKMIEIASRFLTAFSALCPEWVCFADNSLGTRILHIILEHMF